MKLALRSVVALAALVLLLCRPAFALDVKSGVLRIDYQTLLPISRYDLRPDDLGFAGGELGTEDNQTTGSFLGFSFTTDFVATPPETSLEAVDAMLADGVRLIVVIASAEDLLAIADRAGDQALVLNAGARDQSLRDDQCRANVLHVAPSHGMLTDAVAQYALWKRWSSWFLIHGSNPADEALAAAYRASAAKFGAEIAEERVYEDAGASRRTDSGHVLVQKQIPVFAQDADDHDVVIAADASNVFGLFLPYRLWDPRPVLGSGGLRPVTFHGAHEAWGATQFQTRFERLASRYAQEADYETWLALRVIGEAAIRTNSADPAALKGYMMGDEFELAAFKGRKVTFRKWNGQLRQPIILTDSKLTVSVSPQEGYLHQRTTLDTLGLDEPESRCAAFD